VVLAVESRLAEAGRASLAYDPRAHTLSVSVNATGLAPNTRHAEHVHSGSCRVQGAVVYMLPDLVADGDGNATSQVTIRNVTSPPPPQGWYVNVHEGDMNQILVNGMPGALFQPALCGNVTRS
jgi:Cu/Zn superoxide dismutase